MNVTDQKLECSPERRRKIGIVSRRAAEHFFIVDRSLNVLHRSDEVNPVHCSPEFLRGLTETFKAARLSVKPVIEAIDDDTVFRIVPLGGALSGCCSVFVDSFDRRGSLMSAARKFGLTKREMQFIPLLLQGLTTAEMAAALFLAESTVGDHIKSIMRKTMAKKRAEVISRVYSLQNEDPDDLVTSAC